MCVCICVRAWSRSSGNLTMVIRFWGPAENGINVDGNYTFILADYLVSASLLPRVPAHAHAISRTRAESTGRNNGALFRRATVAYRTNLIAPDWNHPSREQRNAKADMRYIRGGAATRIDAGHRDSRGHSTASVECNSAWARGTRVVNSRILCKIDATGYFGGTSSVSSENRAGEGRSIKRRGVQSLKFFSLSSKCRLARSSYRERISRMRRLAFEPRIMGTWIYMAYVIQKLCYRYI